MQEVPQNRPTPPIALTIAGFDPSSGAGITADLKTFAANGVFGVSCATALTVQSTQGVRRVVAVDSTLVSETLVCLADDIDIAGIKIGMLASGSIADAVYDFLSSARVPRNRVVLDPILRSSSGAILLDPAGVSVLRERLLTQVGWITPNLDELSLLVDHVPVTRGNIPKLASQLQSQAERAGNADLNIIVTGGHLDQPDDYFLPANRSEGDWVPGETVHTTSTHGTGCAFSSALLASLLTGHEGLMAVIAAKQYVTAALRAAYAIGKGRGPMDHLYRLRD